MINSKKAGVSRIQWTSAVLFGMLPMSCGFVGVFVCYWVFMLQLESFCNVVRSLFTSFS
jgi:hypothetical protein